MSFGESGRLGECCKLNGLTQSGRGALSSLRSSGVSQCGAMTSENVGMSSVKACENHVHRKPEVSYATLIGVGLARPKPNPYGVGDGQWVNIPMLLSSCYGKGGTQEGRLSIPIGHGVFPTRGASGQENPPWYQAERREKLRGNPK